MGSEAAVVRCPGCGGSLTMDAVTCDYCGNAVYIQNFKTVFEMPLPQINKYVRSYSEQSANPEIATKVSYSLGLCYLKLKVYDNALKCFEKALEEDFDNADAYFYAAVSLLKGQKAFLQQRPTIDKILQYIDAANSINPNALYTYFHAYIKNDYFKRKFFNVKPDFATVLADAKRMGISEADKQQFFSLLSVDRPVDM